MAPIMARKNEEMEMDVETSGPKVYELGFHLDPELPTEEVKKTYQNIKALIESKGSVVAEGEPLMVQLAYTISRQETTGRRDFNSAHFSWIAYETSVENHDEILAAVKEEKRIIRSIDVVTTKDAARHAQELRELALKTPEQSEEASDTTDAALDAALESAAV